MKRKGIYIVFEGIVGVGKSLQHKLLVESLQNKFTNKEIVSTKEPGGTEIAQEIRRVVQGMIFREEMEPICEQYLYGASRAQALRKVVKPALDKNGIVLADRSFFTSLAYQGFGRNLGLPVVLEINGQAVNGLWPDKVFLIDVKIDVALKRVRDQSGDKFENYDRKFFERVRRGYLAVAKKYPKIVEVINGNRDVEKIHEEIYESALGLIMLKSRNGNTRVDARSQGVTRRITKKKV